jgi:hypothetical protein
MDEADELLKSTYQKVYGGLPQFANGEVLPWGEEPGTDHTVLLPRLDRSEEPFIWYDKEPKSGRPPYVLILRFRKSFVAECLAGKVQGVEDPRAWLMDTMTPYIVGDGILRC